MCNLCVFFCLNRTYKRVNCQTELSYSAHSWCGVNIKNKIKFQTVINLIVRKLHFVQPCSESLWSGQTGRKQVADRQTSEGQIDAAEGNIYLSLTWVS